MVMDGPMTGPGFAGFCEWLLAPALNPGDFVVMDNLSSHKSAEALEAIESVGAHVVYLPPYSPDLNPIEMDFSKIKQLLRGLRPRTLTQIVNAAKSVLSAITLEHVENAFLHCGYGS